MEDPGLRILGNLHGLHMCDEGIAGFRGGPDHPGGELVFFDPQGVVERRISLAEVEERAGLTLIDRHTLAVAYPYKHRNRGEVRLMSLAGTPQVTQVIRCDQPTVYSLGTVLRAGGDTLVIHAQPFHEEPDSRDCFVILHRDGDTWRVEAELQAEAELQGESYFYGFAADQGQCVIVGQNTLFFFRRTADGSWPEVSRMRSRSGGSASLQGDQLVLGGGGNVYTYRFVGQTWHAGATWRVARAGTYPKVAVCLSGDELAVGCGARSGTVTLYRREGDDWKEQRKLKTGFTGNHILYDRTRLLHCRDNPVALSNEVLLVHPGDFAPAKPTRRAKPSPPPDQESLEFDKASTPDLSAYQKLRSLALSSKVKRAPGLTALLQRRPGLESLRVPGAALIEPPPENSPLRSLTVDSAKVADLGFLAGFPELEKLHLGARGCKVTDFGPLRSTPLLRDLNAARHKALTLAPLSALRHLQTLSMPQSKALDSLEGLQGCPDLRELDLNQCPGITTLAPLEGASALRRLKLRGARITELSPLYGADRLEILYVERTRLASVGGIAQGLPALRVLWLHRSKVRDIAPLGGLGALEELDLSALKVQDFSALSTLHSLRYLDLFDTSFHDLDLLASLPSLVRVRLSRTPVDPEDPAVKRLDQILGARDDEFGRVVFSTHSTPGWIHRLSDILE